MAEEPDRLRQDIESTRATLTRDVDRLADKTSPKRVAQRRWTTAKERVMGKSEDARHAAGGTAQDVRDSVRQAPQAVAERTQGNPLAAGVIAFGVGMMAATLFPVTDTERRAGRQIKDNAGEVTDRAKDMARDIKDDLSGSVQRAAGELKGTAQDAAQTTRQQATQDVR